MLRILVQTYMATVIFWLIMVVTGKIRLVWEDNKTKEEQEVDLGITIICCLCWIFVAPIILKNTKERSN